MLSRRSILRALGLGAPATAVAAVVGAPAVAEATLTVNWPYSATLGVPGGVASAEGLDVSRLSVTDANMGNVTGGRVRSRDRRTVFDHRSGVITVTG